MEPKQSQTRRDRAVALIRAGLELLRDPSPDEPITVRRELELLDAIRVAAEQLQTQHRVMAADADRRKVAERAVGVPLTTWLKSTGRTTQAVAAATVFAGHDLAAHPEVRAAALEGSVTSRQADSITRVLNQLPSDLSDEQHEHAERFLVEQAGSATHEQLRSMTQRVLDVVDPALTREGAGERERQRLQRQRERALAQRCFRYRFDDGSMIFNGSLPAMDGEALVRLVASYRASERRQARDDGRPSPALGRPSDSPEQRDADALVRIVRAMQARKAAPKVAGDRPRVVVVMQEESLRERAEQAGVLTHGERVSAGDLRRLCCDADLTPVVLGADSELLDVGRTQRLVTDPIRKALSLRDGGCTFPGCEQPDEACDAHHIVPWWEGGPTCLANLVLVCAQHHAMVEPLRMRDDQRSRGSSPPVPHDHNPARPGSPPREGSGVTPPGQLPPSGAPDDSVLGPPGPAERSQPSGSREDSVLVAPGSERDRRHGRSLVGAGYPLRSGYDPSDRWEVRMNASERPEFIPPRRLDPGRTPVPARSGLRIDVGLAT